MQGDSNATSELQPSLPLAAAEHRPELDGVRGVAMLMVLGFHANAALDFSNGGERLWRAVTTYGWAGVDLFFVLSGYLITDILLDTRDSPRFFRNFYMRRALRIFPLYYLVLAHLLSRLPTFEGEVWHWFYLQNWLTLFSGTEFPRIMQPFWSLAVEEQFYLVWPLAAYFLAPRQLGKLCVVVIAGTLAARCFALWQGAPVWAIYTSTCFRLDALAAGSLLAIALRDGAISKIVGSAAWWLLSGSCLGIMVVAWRGGGLTMDEPWMQTVGYTFQAIAFASVLGLLVRGHHRLTPLRWILQLRVLRHLGQRSYAIYILHLPVILLFTATYARKYRGRDAGGTGDCLTLLGALVTILLLAELSWHLHEKQFLKLKRWFPRHASRTERFGTQADSSPSAAAAANFGSSLSTANLPFE